MSTPVDPATIAVGDELPSFQREGTFHHWNRYAAVNDEFVPIHMDDGAGQEAGYDSAFGMGNIQWAYLHNMLRAWVGEQGRILKLGVQFRSPFLRGRTTTAHGTVTAVRPEGNDVLVDLDVWTIDDKGNKMAPGTATVAVPSRS